MNQPIKPDSDFLPLPTSFASVTRVDGSLCPVYTADQMRAAILADRAHRPAVAAWPTNDEVYAEVCRERGNSNLYVSTNAVNDVMAAVRRLTPTRPAVAGSVDTPEFRKLLLSIRDAKHALAIGARTEVLIAHINALIAPAAPSEEAVAQVDEGDDGLFIDIIYGPDGSGLKRGDKLYTRPAPRDVDAPIVLPEKPTRIDTFLLDRIPRYVYDGDQMDAHATAAVQKDRANQEGQTK